ncbi:MAG: glutathione transport system ATP-binding protein, partial [Actinomycetota bacterium]|nr:glutathione transport system ATP-binding protein [Actinomycetota bacterium]
LDAPVGCNFASRCPVFAALPPAKQEKCLTVEPALETGGAPRDQQFACFYPDGELDAELLVVHETS